MAATTPYLLNTNATADIQQGLHTDATGLYINEFSLNSTANVIKHLNFETQVGLMIHNTRELTASMSFVNYARGASFTNIGSGSSVARSIFVWHRANSNHGFSTDSGYWVAGDITRTVPRGDCDTVSSSWTFMGYASTGTAVLSSSGLS